MTQPDKAALADRLERSTRELQVRDVYLSFVERTIIVAALRSDDGMREKVAKAVEDQYPGFQNIAQYIRTLGSEYFGELAAATQSAPEDE